MAPGSLSLQIGQTTEKYEKNMEPQWLVALMGFLKRQILGWWGKANSRVVRGGKGEKETDPYM